VTELLIPVESVPTQDWNSNGGKIAWIHPAMNGKETLIGWKRWVFHNRETIVYSVAFSRSPPQASQFCG
jgi:hypothetical protein